MSRETPCNIEAEQALLGAILVNNDAYAVVEGIVRAPHFHEPIHRQIFEVAGDLIRLNKTANPVTIKAFLPSSDIVVGDMTVGRYLARLAAEAVNVVNAPDYARAIRDMASRRSLISIAEGLIDHAFSPDVDANPWDMISAAGGKLDALTAELGGMSDKTVTMGDAVALAMGSISDAYQRKAPVGIQTGIDVVDQLTGPWEPGQQIIIGAGTKQGKTAIAMQIAVHASMSGPVFIYSGEMSIKQLAMREIARRTGIPVSRQKAGRVSGDEWKDIEAVRSGVSNLPIIIEKRRMTLEQVFLTCKEIKRKRGLELVVIDHVGLLSWGKENSRRDEWELSQLATQKLKEIYETLGVPGMSLVQLKKNTFAHPKSYGKQTLDDFRRSLKSAVNLRPKYTDLMGAVERDADHVIIPFNPQPILAGMEPAENTEEHFIWEEQMRALDGKAEIILALSREEFFPQRRSVEWHGVTTSFGPAFKGKQESLI